MNVDNKTLTQLDYFRIKEDIASRCFSAGGKQILADRTPLTDPESIRVLKQEAVEWTAYLSSGRKPVPGNWEPVDDLTGILETPGAAISLDDTVILGNFCRATVSAAAGLRSAAESLPLPLLSRIAAGIPDLQEPAFLIYRVIDSTGQLRDLPELREIRTNIARIRREIDGAIRRYTTDSALRDILQSDVPVLRADRQVLAVKAGSKNRIKGIIHEVSQTGQTVYIEPEDVVAKNNALVQEEYRLNAEIRRILKELTGRLAPFAPDIAAAAGILARLDASCAAARWGLEHKAVYAADRAATESPVLLQARHPVLADKAVPVDVVFPENCRMLIITGPNTGGKTVTLKTLALFILLNQSGFPVPAAEGTALPLCSGVFADIGDEQSLDQSLSTFSGHMKNIGEMLSKADSSSLVLLDELGSGTDPHEGGAVAMAVLDELLERGALVLVTTHHGILKNYGYTHETCANASAEFDEATLAPTYRIRTGIPGESRALDIARRNGLPPATADRAAAYLSGDQTDISALIRGLTQKHEAADRLEQALKRQQRELREKQRAVDLKELRLKQKELELNRDDYRESRKFLAENRRMLENLVREYRQLTGIDIPADSADDISGRFRFTHARAVKVSRNKQHNYLILDKGTDDGIEENMGVLSADGAVVGYVHSCSEGYSACVSILNRSFSVGGRLGGSEYFGSVYWNGTDPREVILGDIPRYADVAVGDTVRSAYSLRFPSGCLIGTVSSIDSSNDGVYYMLRIRLGARMNALSDVMLVRFTDYDELNGLAGEHFADNAHEGKKE